MAWDGLSSLNLNPKTCREWMRATRPRCSVSLSRVDLHVLPQTLKFRRETEPSAKDAPSPHCRYLFKNSEDAQLARVQLFSESPVDKAKHRVPRGRGNKQGVESKRGSVSAERQAMGYFAGKFGHGIEFQLMVVAPRSGVSLWNVEKAEMGISRMSSLPRHRRMR